MGLTSPTVGILPTVRQSTSLTRLYNAVFYGVDKETGLLNYDTIQEIAERESRK